MIDRLSRNRDLVRQRCGAPHHGAALALVVAVLVACQGTGASAAEPQARASVSAPTPFDPASTGAKPGTPAAQSGTPVVTAPADTPTPSYDCKALTDGIEKGGAPPAPIVNASRFYERAYTCVAIRDKNSAICKELGVKKWVCLNYIEVFEHLAGAPADTQWRFSDALAGVCASNPKEDDAKCRQAKTAVREQKKDACPSGDGPIAGVCRAMASADPSACPSGEGRELCTSFTTLIAAGNKGGLQSVAGLTGADGYLASFAKASQGDKNACRDLFEQVRADCARGGSPAQ